MLTDTISIRVGYGLGNLAFGSRREEVRSYLGEPEDTIEKLLAGTTEVTWQYPSIGIIAYFSEEDEFRLGTLLITRDDARLGDLCVFGLSKQELLSRLVRFAGGAYKEECLEFSDHPSLDRIRFSDSNIEFWFKHQRLNSVTWGYLIDENDEICWPKTA